MGKHTPGPQDDTVLVKQIAYMIDHPGTLGEATAYMKRLEVQRAELLAALQNLIENGESTHAVRRDLAWTQARAAIAKATGAQ